MPSLAALVDALRACDSDAERMCMILRHDGAVHERVPDPVMRFMSSHVPAALREAYTLCACSIVVLGQAHAVWEHGASTLDDAERTARLDRLFRVLLSTQRTYAFLGGLVGYHHAFLRMVDGQALATSGPESGGAVAQVGVPPVVDVRGAAGAAERRAAIAHTLRSGTWSRVGWLLPVGGSGDRLALEREGVPLPACALRFAGHTLLDGLVRDVIGLESLVFQCTGEQVTAPVALMTSNAKRNDELVRTMCADACYWHRPPHRVHMFAQPLVPCISRSGEWAVSAPLTLYTKPGGHGVVWNVARDAGVYEHMRNAGVDTMLVRQVNNPVCGFDALPLALASLMMQHEKRFAFASCPHAPGAAEGVDVLRVRKLDDGQFEHCVTNIEYTEFVQHGLASGAGAARFPTNTNVLCARIDTIERIVPRVPGMTINLKSKVPLRGGACHELGGRVESTMQNIADHITTVTPSPHTSVEAAPALTMFGERKHTISATKRRVSPAAWTETPHSCMRVIMHNTSELLALRCGMRVPRVALPHDVRALHTPLPFTFRFHPALGPLHSVIAQKLRGGSVAEGSDVVLEVAVCEWRDVRVEGALLVHCQHIAGHRDARTNTRVYSHRVGRVTLRNVHVVNAGRAHPLPAWDAPAWTQDVVPLRARCRITIDGDGELHAEDTTLRGDMHIHVAAGTRVTVRGTPPVTRVEKLAEGAPRWRWVHRVSEAEGTRGHVLLRREEAEDVGVLPDAAAAQ